METNFSYNRNNLLQAIIFRDDFKSATLSATQAWSLFFSAGQEDNIFSSNRELGKFFNNLLIAVVVAGVLGSSILFS